MENKNHLVKSMNLDQEAYHILIQINWCSESSESDVHLEILQTEWEEKRR